MLGVGCRRGRGQILSREGEGDGKCRIGFCSVFSFVSVVVVSSLPVRYWDPDWGFVNGSGFVCVGSVIWGEWMVHLCFTRTLCPSPLFPGTLLLSACFVFPNLTASAFSLACSPSFFLRLSLSVLRSPSLFPLPSSFFVSSSLHQLTKNPSVPYRYPYPFIYSVRSLPPPSASVSSLRLHLRNRHRIHPLYAVLSPHHIFSLCLRSLLLLTLVRGR
ncbi:hypothetical protein C8J55DRAFT_502902 [Lentinula edodes]|uniref:Transmembrane protein n=1 Tax=Lentinula lateritia TaxID=40482 RepID=A0A9W9DZ37_9AGAR|nr:hypothetical protein C8J55DRAFT_502902 [Lentinula edodes]